MADKLSVSSEGTAIGNANVATGGSIAVGSVSVAFDEATPCATVIANLRKCEAQIVGYYARKGA